MAAFSHTGMSTVQIFDAMRLPTRGVIALRLREIPGARKRTTFASKQEGHPTFRFGQIAPERLICDACNRQHYFGSRRSLPMTESEPALNGFFLAQQLAIDAARVDRDAKTLCDSFGQMSTGDVRIGRAELRNEIHQFRRQFVPGSRPAFLWQ